LAMMLVLNVPATFGLVVLSTPIVRLLFEHGRFVPADTAATAGALRFYAVGLVGYATARIASPVFYALDRSRVPVIISVSAIALNIVANLLLVRLLGFGGLALGTSIAMIVNGAVLLVLLRRHLDGLEEWMLSVTFVKIVLASCVMGAAAFAVSHLFSGMTAGRGLALQAADVTASILAGIAVLVVMAKMLHIREFEEALSSLTARLK